MVPEYPSGNIVAPKLVSKGSLRDFGLTYKRLYIIVLVCPTAPPYFGYPRAAPLGWPESFNLICDGLRHSRVHVYTS
eukprot:948471-Rhodomonas_salina.1